MGNAQAYTPEFGASALPASQENSLSRPLDWLCINTIRTLAMDAVQRANSGHAGTPIAIAPVAYVLWDRHLRHNPANPNWPNRDRFVLSNGHASMLLYALLHLTGYDLALDELTCFRQWGSRTPGHPEHGSTPGIETTTGPLGQGVANSVGMAMAERWLESHFNLHNLKLVDHHVYAFCGDGDLMEGISQEAASIAGHLGLSNLIWIYDNNRITIEGNTRLAFSDDIAGRFLSYRASLADYLKAHFDRLETGDYFALLAFIEMSAHNESVLQDIRHVVRDGKKVATCLGFGPRFLHSTGQAYKGGPNTGVFLQITCDDAEDLAVPGQKYTFGAVKAAQARGDFQVLAERGRGLLRVHLGPDVAGGLVDLSGAVREALQ